jgi:hypothetical protein
MNEAIESVSISPLREKELLKAFFETVHFDKTPKGLPVLDPEDDDE